jgi:hypothetical protein
VKKKWISNSFIAVLIFGVLLLGIFVLWDLPFVSAENIPSSWYSSADPPDGAATEDLSPPDKPKSESNLDQDSLESRADLRSLSITGSALRPRSSITEFDWGGSGGCIFAQTESFTIFNTAVMLPQGSTVEQVRFYYNDTSASTNSIAWFTIYDFYGNLVDEWSMSSTGSAGQGFSDSVTISHTIDYDNYSYLLNWRSNVLGDSMQLCGIRIFYDPPPLFAQFLPAVTK